MDRVRATGAGSVALHATSTLAGQLIDQSIMFLESSFFIAFIVWRWRGWPAARLAGLYAALVGATTALLLAFPRLGIVLFVAHVLLFLGIELGLYARDRGRTRYGALVAVGITFALSWAVWWRDLLSVVCNPDDHVFQGHAVWHLLGALSFYFWYRHYAQFGALSPRSTPGGPRPPRSR
jgi:hypothetical protein